MKIRTSSEAWPMGYAWFDLPNGETVQVFVNPDTRLIVADVISADESGGIEFMRREIPVTGEAA